MYKEKTYSTLKIKKKLDIIPDPIVIRETTHDEGHRIGIKFIIMKIFTIL
jgi:hypothetical protein